MGLANVAIVRLSRDGRTDFDARLGGGRGIPHVLHVPAAVESLARRCTASIASRAVRVAAYAALVDDSPFPLASSPLTNAPTLAT